MGMNRKQKINYLRKLAAGQLCLEDLTLLLPVKTEVWMQQGPDLYGGDGGELTSRQLEEYADAGKRLRLVVIENPNF
jgi:hypothetical protein